jgi:hypothetical protein
MKIVYWLLGIFVGIPILVLAITYGASELGGEVVTLHRSDANGDVSRVRIWIVDKDGTSWIEHGDSESAYLARLAKSPELVLEREGRETTYIATADRDADALYHRLRREKYGIADQIVALMTGASDECAGVPVLLQLAR